MFIVEFGRYLIVAGLVFAVLWIALRHRLAHRRIQPGVPAPRQMRMEFGYSLLTAIIFATVGVGIYYGGQSGVLKLIPEFKSGDTAYLAFSTTLMIFAHDAYFYWTHRLMHHPLLFRRMHLRHHHSRRPTPWAAYSFAPTEALVQASFAPLFLLFVPMHELGMFLWVGHMILLNAIGHSSIEVFPRGWVGNRWLNWHNTVTHHDLHHSQFWHNYGLYFTWWDRLMGTENPNYRALFDQVSKAKQKTEAKLMLEDKPSAISKPSVILCVIIAFCAAAISQSSPLSAAPTIDEYQTGTIKPYVARFGRTKPVIAVVGENRFTELTDYVIPYGVLTEAGIADVVAVATRPGPIQMFPALKIQPQATISEFDTQFPDGADYVIVPAVHYTQDPALLAWVRAQTAKGATIVGVCDGVWVLANAGLLKGRNAVGHWYSFNDLEEKFPDTNWVKDRRYVADGSVITTTGISASIPVSIALVEAIGGHERAIAVAQSMGVKDWTPDHNSKDFKLKARHMFTAASNWLSFWRDEDIGIAVAPDIDEIALALTADAYSRTYRSSAFSVSPSTESVKTRRGLRIIPDRSTDSAGGFDRMLTLPSEKPPVQEFDRTLQDISFVYGKHTANFVALQMEYPLP